MSNVQQKRSLHIFTAESGHRSGETRPAERDSNLLTLESSSRGYFNPSSRLSRDIDMNAVFMDLELGMIEFEVDRGDRERGRGLLERWCQGRTQVTVVYREFEQKDGAWREKKAMTVLGLISRVKMQADLSCISIDPHALQTTRDGKAGRCPTTPVGPMSPPEPSLRSVG